MPLQRPGHFPEPRAAYVHVPFCRHHCGYCNFSVVAGRDDLFDAFLDALERELRQLESARSVQTLFVGGGTPTHLSPAHLDRLTELLATWLPLEPGGEYTFEANPEDCSTELLQRLNDFGVNRISLGVQSFDQQKLQQLQRGHTPQQAAAAVENAATLFGNVSVDMIFGAHGESLRTWHSDMSHAVALPATHLSTYCLTIEKGSAFFGQYRRGRMLELDEETQLEMYQTAVEIAEAAGYDQYEVSNFARPGYQCRHNIAYWQGDGWYAFGPGAARFIEGRREVNHRSPTTYIRRLLNGESATVESDAISAEQWASEKLAFGLRRRVGISLQEIFVTTGIDVAWHYADTLDHLVEIGMLDRHRDHVRLTEQGLVVSDSVVSEFLG